MLCEGGRVGPYEFIRRLGAGAFGEVWLAQHTDLGAEFALKIPTDAEYVKQLRKEGVITFSVRHPNIVQLHTVDTSHSPPYLAMEYVAGGSLRQRLDESGPLAPGEAVGILRQILAALGAAHEAGIIHRDLKPSNILLATDGTVKVADFGLGRAHAEAIQSLLLSGSLVTIAGKSVSGTVAYMSPEQQEGEEPTPSDDLYAVGIVACELLAGRRPSAGSLARLLSRAGVAQALVQVIEKACEEREYRYATAAEMLDDLARVDVSAPTAAERPARGPEPRPAPSATAGGAQCFPPVIEAAVRKALKKGEGEPIGPDELQQVTELSSSSIDIYDDDLVHLARLPGLQRLVLTLSQVTDAGMVHVAALGQLRQLYLSGTRVSDAGLLDLKPLSGLTSLALNGTRVTDAGLAHLDAFRQLDTLFLGEANVTDAGLRHLASRVKLQWLDLKRTSVTSAGLSHLLTLRRLEKLNLSGTRVNAEGLALLGRLRTLREVWLDDTSVDDAALAHLAGLRELDTLWLGNTPVGDAGLVHLAGLTGLRLLWLPDTQVTDAGLVHLWGLMALWNLNLSGTQVTDAGLAHLEGLRALRRLKLEGSQVTAAGIARLKAALPQCEVQCDPA